MKKCTNKILWEHVNVPIPCVKTAGIRNLKIILSIILIAGLFAGCAAEREKKCSINPLFKLDNLKNGDAKFFGENILASVGGKLYLFDKGGHPAMLTNDKEFIALSKEFLNRKRKVQL